MLQPDPVAFALKEKLHCLPVHEHHLLTIEGDIASVAPHVTFDVRHILSIDTPDKTVYSRPSVARRLDPEQRSASLSLIHGFTARAELHSAQPGFARSGYSMSILSYNS
jgi:hypothetical protein